MPVHPICSGGKPDSNGGVAQGLRDTVACLLQSWEHIIAGVQSRGGSRDEGRRESWKQGLKPADVDEIYQAFTLPLNLPKWRHWNCCILKTFSLLYKSITLLVYKLAQRPIFPTLWPQEDIISQVHAWTQIAETRNWQPQHDVDCSDSQCETGSTSGVRQILGKSPSQLYHRGSHWKY